MFFENGTLFAITSHINNIELCGGFDVLNHRITSSTTELTTVDLPYIFQRFYVYNRKHEQGFINSSQLCP